MNSKISTVWVSIKKYVIIAAIVVVIGFLIVLAFINRGKSKFIMDLLKNKKEYLNSIIKKLDEKQEVVQRKDAELKGEIKNIKNKIEENKKEKTKTEKKVPYHKPSDEEIMESFKKKRKQLIK